MNDQSKILFTFFFCVSEILSMSGTMFFPTLLPHFQKIWQLSHTEAGFINGIFYAGYAFSAPILVSLTDRKDARRIYLLSTAVGAVSMLGFALFASNTWTAALFRFAAGISLAGTYMPGLKILSESIQGIGQSRAISFYTASYGIGTALSVYLSGILFSRLDWVWAACILSAGYILCMLLFSLTVAPQSPHRPSEKPERPESQTGPRHTVFDFRKVIRNRAAAGYIIQYAIHCWELFGFRSWLVAFLVFCAFLHPGSTLPLTMPEIASLIILAGVPASILGNEFSLHWGRERSITFFMVLSGTIGCLIGFSAQGPMSAIVLFCFIYGIAIMLDSGSLTAGLVSIAVAGESGVTLAVYSFAGFSMAFLAPLAFGAVMDLFGAGIWGWGAAFALLGIANITGPFWRKALQRRGASWKPLP